MHTYDAAQAAVLDLALELFVNGECATLAEAEETAIAMQADLDVYATAYDAEVQPC